MEDRVFQGSKSHFHKPKIDMRGEFVELYGKDFEPFQVAQISRSVSFKNVFRGIHFQPGMKKSLRVLTGEIILYTMDMRPNSPTFGQIDETWAIADPYHFYTSEDWMGRGFYITKNDTTVEYLQSSRFDPQTAYDVRGYHYFGFSDYVTVSDKDRNARTVDEWKTFALENGIFV